MSPAKAASREMFSENAASELGWGKQGVSKTPKWAHHHCPRGHAWKGHCFERGLFKLCPIQPALGVLLLNGRCPSCGEKQDAAEAEVKDGKQHRLRGTRSQRNPRRLGGPDEGPEQVRQSPPLPSLGYLPWSVTCRRMYHPKPPRRDVHARQG
jgi:hypothetical protein